MKSKMLVIALVATAASAMFSMAAMAEDEDPWLRKADATGVVSMGTATAHVSSFNIPNGDGHSIDGGSSNIIAIGAGCSDVIAYGGGSGGIVEIFALNISDQSWAIASGGFAGTKGSVIFTEINKIELEPVRMTTSLHLAPGHCCDIHVT